MKKNKIKDTGLEVTELSFGTSSLGSMPDTYGYEVPEQRAQETLKRFFQGPANMLDTSRNYAMGESEKRIGIAIKKNGGWPENFIWITVSAGVSVQPRFTPFTLIWWPETEFATFLIITANAALEEL